VILLVESKLPKTSWARNSAGGDRTVGSNQNARLFGMESHVRLQNGQSWGV